MLETMATQWEGCFNVRGAGELQEELRSEGKRERERGGD